MHEIDDTLEKLVKVAKKKGYLDPEATVESLKEEARARAATERAAKSEREESSTGQMEAMRKRLDTQTAAVRIQCFSLVVYPGILAHPDPMAFAQAPQHALPCHLQAACNTVTNSRVIIP